MININSVDIVSAQFKANPFPLLASLRQSQPVFQTSFPDKTPVWLITRYGDVLALLRDERFVNLIIHGEIPRGAMTFGVIGSANRDETVFENADQLNLSREPNRHLAFGQGIHFCVGAPLARLEAEIAFNTLLRRLPTIHLAVDVAALRWRPSMLLRGLKTLPVQY